MGYKELSIAVLESGFNELKPDSELKRIHGFINILDRHHPLGYKQMKKLKAYKEQIKNNTDARKFFESGNFLTWIGLTDFTEEYITDKYMEIIGG